MNKKLHLFIGFGDIAARCSRLLLAQGDAVVGVSRSERTEPEGVEWIQGDALSVDTHRVLAEYEFESVVITLTPDTYTPEAYRRCYYEVSAALLNFWKDSPDSAPQKIIFVSSTSVYSQSLGELVDESSETNPTSPNAKILLEAEALYLTSKLNTCVIRFSGIYGPGRDYLIRQVQQGIQGNDCYTNRIHVEDCAGAICFLINKEKIKSLYLASDSEPVVANEIRRWLAGKMGVTLSLPPNTNSTRGGNKRCSNERLLCEGYSLKYPGYKQGYKDLIL